MSLSLLQFCSSIFSLFFLFLLSLSSLSISIFTRDSEILLRVKNGGISDPNNRLFNWIAGPPCNWTGITCARNRSVIGIDLSNLGLSGRFPVGFCRIRTLRMLKLASNSFNGSISSQFLSLCSQLHRIRISENVFTGNLPDFSPDFVNLRQLDFSCNNFSGEIPASFGRLPALRLLNLSGNALDSNAIPEFLTNLSELTHLELAYNPFRPSKIPSAIGNLTKLKEIWIAGANLIGEIPVTVGKLLSLRNFDVSGNSLSGRIPHTIGRLQRLVQLELYENRFSDELPESLGNLTSLRMFDASENFLSGEIPVSLAALPLISFNLNDNLLTGKIPVILASNPNLIQLKLFNNSFSGEVPLELGLRSNLMDFDVSTNKLSGEFPVNLCYRKNLRRIVAFDNQFFGNFLELYKNCATVDYIRLQNNNLSGTLPANYFNFPKLYHFEISNNRFFGELPNAFSNDSKFDTLLFSGNEFIGKLPSGLCQLQRLMQLDLSTNNFSGELPDCLSELRVLQILNLAENRFSGEFLIKSRTWTHLTELDLSKNRLSGPIPSLLADLPVLNYLDLSENSFSGKIPPELTKQRLNHFNISNNKLAGKIPSGFNRQFYIDSLTGNPNLCSPDLEPFPPCSKSKPVLLYLISILASVAFVLSLISILFLYKRKLSKKRSSKPKHPYKMTTFQRVGFDRDEIFRSLTEDNWIGEGGSGRVYRVGLRSGQTIAVKKLWGGVGGRWLDSEAVFRTEVETLGNVRHGNIVKLLFSCTGEDFRLLGYEFMENGSLGDVLHGKKGGGLLDWPRRFAIAVGAARGLTYLHHDCVPTVVHRDVKSNNILLDEEFQPKVADFGLAKVLRRGEARETAEDMSRIAGSYGYIAPEYVYTLKVTEKSDVYSFGVVLMELVTGKRPNDPSFGEGQDIVKWVSEIALKSLEIDPIASHSEAYGVSPSGTNQLVDPRMNPETCNYEEIKKVLGVALFCTSYNPMDRPPMRRVVELLRGPSLAHQSSKVAAYLC